MAEVLSTLADHLADYIQTHGCHQTDVAGRIGTTQQAVSRWLKGSRPEENFWGALAELLGLTYDQVEEIVPSSSRQSHRRGAAESLRSIGSAAHGGKETPAAPETQTREELLVEIHRLQQRVTELEKREHDLMQQKQALIEAIAARAPCPDIDDYRSSS